MAEHTDFVTAGNDFIDVDVFPSGNAALLIMLPATTGQTSCKLTLSEICALRDLLDRAARIINERQKSSVEYHVRFDKLGIKCETCQEAIEKAKAHDKAVVVEISAGIEKPILLWDGDQLFPISELFPANEKPAQSEASNG